MMPIKQFELLLFAQIIQNRFKNHYDYCSQRKCEKKSKEKIERLFFWKKENKLLTESLIK